MKAKSRLKYGLVAAKNLLKRYKSITLGQLSRGSGRDVLPKLTGFGTIKTCSLCIATIPNGKEELKKLGVYPDCTNCIWGFVKGIKTPDEDGLYPCFSDDTGTLGRMADASGHELASAIMLRIKELEGHIRKLERHLSKQKIKTKGMNNEEDMV